MEPADGLIKNARLPGSDNLQDIEIRDGRISKIESGITGSYPVEINANGMLVGPGFVDCHTHCNKAYAACGSHRPHGNDGPWSFDHFNVLEKEYVQTTPIDKITDRAVRNIRLAAAAGTTHMRSHVVVDDQRELKHVNAMIAARERTKDLIDLQIVPKSGGRGFTDSLANHTSELLEEAIRLITADAAIPNPVILGGSDPALGQQNIEETFQTWFDIASAHDIEIDFHLQDGGTLGIYTIDRLTEYIQEYDYQNKVTVSHGYALAHIPDWWLDRILPSYSDHGVKFVTCHQTTPPGFPIRTVIEKGVTLGIGTDNVCDYVFPYGNADPLEGPYILLNKLHGDMTFDPETRWYQTNQGLATLWELITDRGAEVLSLPKYGLRVGNQANLIVFDEPSIEWAILNQSNRRFVLKDGRIIANNGTLIV